MQEFLRLLRAHGNPGMVQINEQRAREGFFVRKRYGWQLATYLLEPDGTLWQYPIRYNSKPSAPGVSHDQAEQFMDAVAECLLKNKVV